MDRVRKFSRAHRMLQMSLTQKCTTKKKNRSTPKPLTTHIARHIDATETPVSGEGRGDTDNVPVAMSIPTTYAAAGGDANATDTGNVSKGDFSIPSNERGGDTDDDTMDDMSIPTTGGGDSRGTEMVNITDSNNPPEDQRHDQIKAVLDNGTYVAIFDEKTGQQILVPMFHVQEMPTDAVPVLEVDTIVTDREEEDASFIPSLHDLSGLSDAEAVIEDVLNDPDWSPDNEANVVSDDNDDIDRDNHNHRSMPNYVDVENITPTNDNEQNNNNVLNNNNNEQNNNHNIGNQMNENDENEPPVAAVEERSQKKRRMPESRKQGKKKRQREQGLPYDGKAGRALKERCHCALSDSRQCESFSDEERQKIFDEIWKQMTWDQRKIFVNQTVDAVPTAKKGDGSRRQNTLMYFLKKDGVRKRVCRTMYLATTSLGRWSVASWAKTIQPMRERNSPYYHRADEQRQFMITEFLEKLEKMPSHYCRSSSDKVYLEPAISSIADLYKLYKEKCEENQQTPLSRFVLMEEFNRLNMSLYRPKKDQCDICVAREANNVDEDLWQEHILRKDLARSQKSQDKELAIECMQDGYEAQKTLVICVDAQATLTCPRIQASALYYKKKLNVHNYTVYNLGNSDVVCYVWHEGEGGVTANEFTSCILDYLSDHTDGYDTVVVYSDGCGYQNRNVTLSNAYLEFAKKSGKTVIQKILEKGHTQSEVDSVHATIERRLKPNLHIYTPAQYVGIIETSRHAKPYEVKYLDYTFFKDFSILKNIQSIRPGTTRGDPVVTDLRAMRYSSQFGMEFKVCFSDEWQTTPGGRSQRTRGQNQDRQTEPPQLYDSPLKITQSKYIHLQELKQFMPRDFHNFYDQLAH